MNDDFDPREYLLTVDTNTDAIADKLVTEFGFHEGPRSRKNKGVRAFHTSHDERNMWRGYLTITRTYVGDEKNQTWAVDWYPRDGNPKHIHTSGPQHKLLDFLSYFQTSLHTNWMTNRQAIKQAAVDKGFDTTYIDNPVGESAEDFSARDYLLNDPEPKTPEQLFDYHGYELSEGSIYNKFWPVKDGFTLNVGGKHQSALGSVRMWACIMDDNGAAYFGQYTVPVEGFSEWLSNADKVMPSVQAAANAAPDVTSAQGYADMQAAWETVFPYEPDAPVQESEDFDPRDYLLSAPADYVVKWTFGPPKPGRHLYRYTRINGVTSEEAALREWQAKMEKDWGWRVGDDKKPHLVKVTRAVIQDRPVQENEEPFDAREYMLSGTSLEDVARRLDAGLRKGAGATVLQRGLPIQGTAVTHLGRPVTSVWCYFTFETVNNEVDFVVRCDKEPITTQRWETEGEADAGKQITSKIREVWEKVRVNTFADYDEFVRDFQFEFGPVKAGFNVNPLGESEELSTREYFLQFPAIACEKCDADLQAPSSIRRIITFTDGKTTQQRGHASPNRDWEDDEGFDPAFANRTMGEIVDVQNLCANCFSPISRVEESDDFDAKDYFLTLPDVPGMLKSMRYEISRDGAAKVFKGANDRDYMLFVTLRGGQSLDMGQPESIYDLGIYVGKGRDWDCLKHIYAMTRYDMQETLEQAENAIRKGEWTGLGLSINRVNDSLEEPPGDFDARDYLMRDEGAALDELGFERMPIGWTKSGERLWSRTQGTIRIDVHNYGDDEWFVLGWVNNDGNWERHDIESYYTGKGISLKQVIDNIDASCRGVYEGLEEPPADDFDPRQYFIDSSSVQFNLNGKREAWNFGAESRKDIELFNGSATLRLKYLADEWHPRWEFEVHGTVPWKGQFEKVLVKRTSETERLLPKRIEQVLAAANKWYEQNKWGMAIYPLIYGPNGVKDYVGEHPDWADFVEQNAGDLPSEFENQTEETAAAWKDLIFRFRAERKLGVQESEDAFDPREYVMADVGQTLVNRLKELGYKQVHLHVMTDRHATLTMNDPDPEYEDEENGGGIDQTKRVYARNRVKTAVRELMGLATSVYDFSGDGGTDYLFKITDPEHMGIHGRFEAQDNFDPYEYMVTMPKDEIWRVIWVGTYDGTEYRTKGFPSAEKAMRYVYTSSLFNKADTVKLERRTGNDFNEYDWKEFPVTPDYELIDPDTGRVLIREALVLESEEQDFSARDYLLQPQDDHGLMFLDWLEAVGFDARGENTYELNQWGTRFVVQRYKNGKYRYAIYDPDGHKMRGQLVSGPGQLVDLLQQHLGMRLKQESEEDFDARAYMLAKTSDDSVLQWMQHNGFKEAEYPGGVPPKFYAVWEKTIGPYQIAAYRGVYDDKLGSHRWWLEIWDHGKHHGAMGSYFSAENFLPRLQAQVRFKTEWAEHEQSTAANA